MKRVFRFVLTLMALIGVATPVHAAGEPNGLTQAALLALVREGVEQAAQSVMAAYPGVRVATQVGALNPQLKLAPCEAAQPHFNPGSRAWGDIRIGLRCTQGPVRWNIYVPATIRVYGPAWVAASALPAGHLIGESDVLRQEAEWSSESGAILGATDNLAGRQLAAAVKAGQPLRVQHVRARQWFTAGQNVTLVARGPGFAVTSEGVALTPGLDGQATRVRLDNGRVLQGTAVGTRRVEVAM
jgi:flagella basal body P-ring formation protein FlgA